ncbi:hypothetical protein [Dokdonia sp.]|uniref:hypothetical protein n=1 Tax=Dokdonia sp. TaxID=2024995 RepID=UPI00326691F3
MKKITIITLILSITSLHIKAQEFNTKETRFTAHNKGKIYLYWGGNRGNYSRSDITFKGNDYKFTVKNAVARDLPKGYHIDYINPTRLTIPQTNFRLGYFITDHYNISFGIDHMKYVVQLNQIASITGTINLPETAAGSIYNGTYSNDPVPLTEDFLTFEHTDGLNYLNLEITRVDDISGLFKIRNTDIFQINITEAAGSGILYPKTLASVLGSERNDEFHISGYGVSAKAGLNFTFFKHFFIQTELKGGYINMYDIRTTQSSSDSAKQDFWFLERVIALGGIFKL